MNKLIFSIILGFSLISLISALTYNLTAGESQSFDLEEEFAYYSIVGNSTEIDINVSQEGTIVTITPNKYSSDDSFEIIFFNTEKEIIEHYSGGGGGRGRTETIIKNNTIEVPNYITVYEPNETIKEIPIKEPKEFDYTSLFIGGLILAILIIGKLYLTLKKRNLNRVKKEVNKNE